MDDSAFRFEGLYVKNHLFDLPLDYSKPEGEKIKVFAREVSAQSKEKDDLPFLLFLQGGPGFPSPRPTAKNGWLKRALQDYRVLYLDQRGTGMSTPVTFQTLVKFPSAQGQADYLKLFRADNIVRDAESIRRQLIGEKTWSLLGQSYGGFCITHYLSASPEGITEAFIAGGVPITEGDALRVYQHTYHRVASKNKRFYERYPEDVDNIHRIVRYLESNHVELPAGGQLTARRFQQFGINFGFTGQFERLHYLVEEAFVEGADGPELSYGFLRSFENSQSFETNPIFAILHESIYCNSNASNWAAERAHQEFKEFEISPDQPLYFVGEMVFSWMFDDYKYLQPLKEAAEILAAYDQWPDLYDFEVLANTYSTCSG